jgi:hypothetical protein
MPHTRSRFSRRRGRRNQTHGLLAVEMCAELLCHALYMREILLRTACEEHTAWRVNTAKCVRDQWCANNTVTQKYTVSNTHMWNLNSILQPRLLEVDGIQWRDSGYGRITQYLVFCWPGIIVHQYSETNVMHFLFNLLRIKGLYIFRALLAHTEEALHKRHLVYCVRFMSDSCYQGWSGTAFQPNITRTQYTKSRLRRFSWGQ